MANELKTITVQGTGNDNRVVIWEKDSRHPNGEVMVVNNGKSVTVAETAAVKRLVGEGKLTTQVSDTSFLRPATEEEKDAAGLTGEVERQTAITEERKRK